jgi:hypothetical protein
MAMDYHIEWNQENIKVLQAQVKAIEEYLNITYSEKPRYAEKKEEK